MPRNYCNAQCIALTKYEQVAKGKKQKKFCTDSVCKTVDIFSIKSQVLDFKQVQILALHLIKFNQMTFSTEILIP
jgi:hypothetical protein